MFCALIFDIFKSNITFKSYYCFIFLFNFILIFILVQCPYKKVRKIPPNGSIIEKINTQTQLKWSLFNSNVGPYAFENRFSFPKKISIFKLLLIFICHLLFYTALCVRVCISSCVVHRYVWNLAIWASLEFTI